MRILFLLFLGFHLFAADPIGKVVALQGSVIAKTGSAERALSSNSDVFVKELIVVAIDALAQIQFTDGGIINLIGGTEYRINTYKYQKTFQRDQSSSELLKGGFRALSGSIAKTNPKNFEVRTPSATIGLRGTILEVVLDNETVYVGVEAGKAEVKNRLGSVMVGVGEKTQFVVIPGSSTPPELLTERPFELERSIFIPPPGGLSIDQVQSTRAAQAPAAAPQLQPTQQAAPTDTDVAPSISETPDEGEFEFQSPGGGASIQGGSC